MKHWKVVFAIGCGLIVAGCGEESAVQKAVRARLKDPDSAKFGKGTLSKIERAIPMPASQSIQRTPWVAIRVINRQH